MLLSKTVFALSTILLVLSGFGCEKSDNKSVNTTVITQPTPTPTTTAALPKDGNYNARGKVTKINNELGSVELDHEDIPGVMAAMRMEFFVKNKAELKLLKIGDQVDFVLEYKHPTETIVSIKKAK